MMRPRKIFIVYVLVIAILLFSGVVYHYGRNGGGGLLSEEDKCVKSGGLRAEFPNTCVDSCNLARNPGVISCGLALTYGCDCGSNECWNFESGKCEGN